MRIRRLIALAMCVTALIAVVVWTILMRRSETYENPPKTTRFATTNNPWGVQFSKDGKHLFVGGESLMVYELRGLLQPTLVRTVKFADTMGAARGLSLSPDGQTLVAGRAKHISFFSVPGLTRGEGQAYIASVPVPALATDKRRPNAAEPKFSPDGTRVVCPIEYQRRVMVVDVELALQKAGSSAIVGFIPAGSAPVGISFFPEKNSNLVAFTNQSDGDVSKVGGCSGSLRIANFRTMEIEEIIPIAPGCDAVRVVIDGAYMYVSSRSDNKIIRINRSNRELRVAFPVGPNPVGIAVVGRKLIVAASNRFDKNSPGEINILDASTGKIDARIPGLAFPRGVAVSPDGSVAAITYFAGGAVELV
jgi:DNA-binding beta-propeller fold protein YncE